MLEPLDYSASLFPCIPGWQSPAAWNSSATQCPTFCAGSQLNRFNSSHPAPLGIPLPAWPWQTETSPSTPGGSTTTKTGAQARTVEPMPHAGGLSTAALQGKQAAAEAGQWASKGAFRHSCAGVRLHAPDTPPAGEGCGILHTQKQHVVASPLGPPPPRTERL